MSESHAARGETREVRAFLATFQNHLGRRIGNIVWAGAPRSTELNAVPRQRALDPVEK
jgi:hypothetical protein